MTFRVPEFDMHSHDRTLISRLGFADPDKGDRRHDLACQFLASREVAESIGRQFIRPLAAEQLCAERRWCSDYSNEPDIFVRAAIDGELAFEAIHEAQLSKGEGKYKTVVGFLDLYIRYGVPLLVSEERCGEVTESHNHEILYAFFEVKVKPIPVGDIVRQVRFYRPHADYGRHKNLWFIVTSFSLSESDAAVLTGAGIQHIQLGNKFEEWASIQEASAPAKPAMEL